jgi:hypothetical protein
MASVTKAVGDFLYELIISGGYNKGGSWGGEECARFVPNDIHIKESVVWICFMVFLYCALGFTDKMKQLNKTIQEELDMIIPKRNKAFRYLDIMLGTLAICNWTLVLVYKINLKSLINLLQPCHIVLLAQGFALLSNSSTGVMITLLSLPMVTGSGSAILFPDTSGLDQYLEEPAFWLQHYFIQSVPLYLLLRYEFLATKVFDFKTFLIGNWILVFTHWIFFEPIDYIFHVNVNFFLCPAAAMQAVFDGLPPALMWPSYRTLLMWSFVGICIPVLYAYVYAAKVVHWIYENYMHKPLNMDDAIDIIKKIQNDTIGSTGVYGTSSGSPKKQQKATKNDNRMSSTYRNDGSTSNTSSTKSSDHYKRQ